MMADSIVTVIERRYAHGHDLALQARQRSWTMHQLQIQLVMLAHDGRVNAVNLQDVVRVRHAVFRRQVLVAHITDKRHATG